MGIRGNFKEPMKTSESSAESVLAMRARNQRWLPDVFVLPIPSPGRDIGGPLRGHLYKDRSPEELKSS